MNLDDLERLARLKEVGALTEEEFQAQKARIISGKESKYSAKLRYAFWVIGIGCVLIAGLLIGTRSDQTSENSPIEQVVGNEDVAQDSYSRSENLAPSNQVDTSTNSISGSEEPENLVAKPPRLPEFADFLVPMTTRTATLKLFPNSPEWGYRTRIQEAYGAAPNFSANSVLALWGCGTGCRMGVMVDRSTGNIFGLPLGGEDNMYLELSSEHGSNLLKATWQEGYGSEAKCVFEAFIWSEGGFDPISGFPVRNDGSCPSG